MIVNVCYWFSFMGKDFVWSIRCLVDVCVCVCVCVTCCKTYCGRLIWVCLLLYDPEGIIRMGMPYTSTNWVWCNNVSGIAHVIIKHRFRLSFRKCDLLIQFGDYFGIGKVWGIRLGKRLHSRMKWLMRWNQNGGTLVC